MAEPSRPPPPSLDLTRFRNLRLGSESAPAPTPAKPEPPSPPNWLPPAAVTEWQRVAPLLTPWQERYADALAVYAVEIAAYKSAPGTFNSARLAQLRLLMVTLRLVPEIGQR